MSTTLGTHRRDRTVHAILCDGREVVRYDRPGKWYVEDFANDQRRAISVTDAARLAHEPQTRVLMLQPGGRLFDAAYRQMRGPR